MRHRRRQRRIAAGGSDGAVEFAVVPARRVGQRHGFVGRADGGDLRRRTLLRGQRGALGFDQHARFEQVEGTDIVLGGRLGAGGEGGAASRVAVTNTPVPTRTST